jgi:hypothetical protein
MVHVGDDGDIANTWVQIENSSGSHIGDLLLLYYDGSDSQANWDAIQAEDTPRTSFASDVDVDGRRSHFVVVVAKPLAVQSGRVAGISIGFSLFTRFALTFV